MQCAPPKFLTRQPRFGSACGRTRSPRHQLSGRPRPQADQRAGVACGMTRMIGSRRALRQEPQSFRRRARSDVARDRPASRRRRAGGQQSAWRARRRLLSVEHAKMAKRALMWLLVPHPLFDFQPNDSRTVRFPAKFALRVDFLRYMRVAAHVSQLRCTHATAVKASSSHTPTFVAAALDCLCAAPSLSISRFDEPA